MGIVDDVGKILAIKVKPRQDSYSDQFSRIIMLKVMFIGALFTGMNWSNDKINCIIPKDQADAGFTSSSCWINGLYVYENIRYHNNDIGYYGLPRDIRFNGMDSKGKLCETDDSTTNPKPGRNKDCSPMEKTYFLQYQYFTFFLVMMGALYYAPYMFFKYVNTDIQSLKESIKGGDADHIFNTYFNHNVNSPSMMSFRVLGTLITKVLYICANVIVFVLTNHVLSGNFQSYGKDYATWTTLNNTMAYDYMGRRHYPKPGDVLLPSFAFCEVHEMAEDVKGTYDNKNRFVCEMSQHILYQYVLIVVWWAMVVGIVASILGLLIFLVDYTLTKSSIKRQLPPSSASKLMLREFEYLEYIRRKDMTIFSKVLKQLYPRTRTPIKDVQDRGNELNDPAPSYDKATIYDKATAEDAF